MGGEGGGVTAPQAPGSADTTRAGLTGRPPSRGFQSSGDVVQEPGHAAAGGGPQDGRPPLLLTGNQSSMSQDTLKMGGRRQRIKAGTKGGPSPAHVTIYTERRSPAFPGDTHTPEARAAGQGFTLGTWEAGAGRDPQVPTGPLERHPGGGLGPKLVAASLFTSRLCCVTRACDYHARAGPLTARSGAVCAEGHGGQTERRPVQGACTFNPIFTHPRYHYGPASVVSGNRGSERRKGACPLHSPPAGRQGWGERALVPPPYSSCGGPGFRPPHPSPPPTAPPARGCAHTGTFCPRTLTQHYYRTRRSSESWREEQSPRPGVRARGCCFSWPAVTYPGLSDPQFPRL